MPTQKKIKRVYKRIDELEQLIHTNDHRQNLRYMNFIYNQERSTKPSLVIFEWVVVFVSLVTILILCIAILRKIYCSWG